MLDDEDKLKLFIILAILGAGLLGFMAGVTVGISLANGREASTNYWSPLLRGYNYTGWCVRKDRAVFEVVKEYAGGGYPPSVCQETLQGSDRIGI